jgi:hypothetical protein
MQLTDSLKTLLIETAKSLKGSARRAFIARTVKELGPTGQQRAARELGCGRMTSRKGMREQFGGLICLDAFALRGGKRAEDHLPILLTDIQAIVDSQSQAKYQAAGDGIPEFLADLTSAAAADGPAIFSPHRNIITDFCVPENEKFIGYWDRVEDRLFKIRHSQNKEIGGTFKAVGEWLDGVAGVLDKAAAVTGKQGEYKRREEDWQFEIDTATFDRQEIEHQIAAAMLQLDDAARELTIHQKDDRAEPGDRGVLPRQVQQSGAVRLDGRPARVAVLPGLQCGLCHRQGGREGPAVRATLDRQLHHADALG